MTPDTDLAECLIGAPDMAGIFHHKCLEIDVRSKMSTHSALKTKRVELILTTSQKVERPCQENAECTVLFVNFTNTIEVEYP